MNPYFGGASTNFIEHCPLMDPENEKSGYCQISSNIVNTLNMNVTEDIYRLFHRLMTIMTELI